MTWLQYVRLITLGVSVLCGIIVLSLASHLTSLSIKYFEDYYNFAVLSIAVGGLTMLTVPVMILIDFLRTGALTSMVLVELVWLSILWVLWIAAAALTADQTSAAFSSCDFVYPILNQVCNETRAIEAFAFLAWIDLMAYTIILLVVALVNGTRGAPMWTTSIKERPSIVPRASTNAPAPVTAAPQMGMMPQAQPGYAPVPTGSPATGYSTTAAAPSSHGAYPQV
ncbi:hypothetical protein FKP32DRAFT_1614607 [Trametes sanguinea]|nr:hypothetical protein FKP32DRAFT_1614607 [Trametes sanguinea]